MADPASIIGILGVCMQLTEGIIKYSAYFKQAPKDAADLVAEVGALEHVLNNLRTQLELNAPSSNSFERTSVLFSALNGCRKRLVDIHSTLKDLVSNKSVVRFWQRLVWPFERTQTKDDVLALHRFAQIFHFALTLDGLSALSLSQHDAIEKIQSTHADIGEILEAIKELSSLSTQIRVLSKSVNELVIDQQLTQLLDAIPSLPYNDRHRDLQITRMEGVGQWILDVPEFVQWRSGQLADGTLWCNGAPGAGKTYISSVVVDHLQDLTTYNNSTVLFFYFDYKLQSEQTPLKFIQTLLHQLLSSFSAVPREAEQLYQNISKRKDLAGWNDLKALFLDICSHLPSVFIVLDALDECDKECNRERVREFINDVKASTAKLLVTSRPYPADIDELLGGCSQILVEASEKDIRAYILDRISRSKQISKLIDGELKQEIIKSVTSKSQGMFLLPALQMNNILGQTNKSQIKKVLQSLPNGLADNLLLTIERIKAQHPQSDTRANLALQVLMWLSTVRRPLTTQELQHAIAIDPESNSLDDLTNPEFFVDCCFGLVVIDEMSVIKLVHFSVSEFLETQRDELFSFPDGQVAVSCLSYLLARPKKHDGKIGSLPSNVVRNWHLMDYSVRFWGIHAAKGFNDTTNAKCREFYASLAAVGLWMILLKHQISRRRWNEDRDWVSATKLVAKGQNLMHLAAIYGIPKLCNEIMLEQPPCLNGRDVNGSTPLMLAAAIGSLSVVELLLANPNTDVNARNTDNRTALWHAVQQQRLPVIRALFNSHSHLDINHGSPFRAVCKYGSHQAFHEIWELFIRRPDLDVNAAHVKTRRNPPWYSLVRLLRFQHLQTLVAHPGFDPWKSGRPSFLYRKLLEDHKDITREPILFGDDITVGPAIIKLLENDFRFAFTPWFALELIWPFVYYAFSPILISSLGPRGCQIDGIAIFDDESQSRKHRLRRLLLTHGISIDYTDSKGNSFLHYFAKVGEADEELVHRTGTIDFFLQHLQVDIKNHEDQTPLHVAAGYGHEKLVLKLLRAGANVMALTEDSTSILHYVAGGGHLGLLELLVNHGANVHAKNKYGESVLHWAVKTTKNAAQMIAYLVDRGVDVNEETLFGWTPLHVSVYRDTDVIKTLVKLGANPAKCTKERGSALHDALFQADTKVAQTLLEYDVGDLNQPDSFGMSVFDYLRAFPPEFATRCGLTEQHWATANRGRSHIQQKNTLHFLQRRLDLLISGNDRSRNRMASFTGFRLIKLGDEAAAQVMYETFALPQSKQGTVCFYYVSCGGCNVEEGTLFKCKICPFNWLCEKCRVDRDLEKGRAPQCLGHDFLQVPGDDWKNIPVGKVNLQGQTFLEWLVDLRERYRTIKE